MNTGSLRLGCPARVYTMILAFIVALAASRPAPAEPRITEEPTLTKGPATAPVTIVEFSDYQ